MADFFYKIFSFVRRSLHGFFLKVCETKAIFVRDVCLKSNLVLLRTNEIKTKIKKIYPINRLLKNIKKFHLRFAGIECLTLLAVVMSFVFPQNLVKYAFASVDIIDNSATGDGLGGYSLIMDDSMHSLSLEKGESESFSEDYNLNQTLLSQDITSRAMEKNFQIASNKKHQEFFVVATAYSSSPDQTDDTPFITANGMTVYDGLIAANFLRFGTKIKIPDHYGDKVFTVNDRMNARYGKGRIDLWMAGRSEAKTWGVKKVRLLIID